MDERRRSKRKPIQVTVQMIGIKPGTSNSTAVPAEIIDASDHGALIECRSKFEPMTELMIQLQDSLLSALAVVVRTNPAGSAWRMGIELKDAFGKDLWGAD